jgi:hypothetical protein
LTLKTDERNRKTGEEGGKKRNQRGTKEKKNWRNLLG